MVLETGGPVLHALALMRPRAVLEAWYPGQKGRSRRLPKSFLARPARQDACRSLFLSARGTPPSSEGYEGDPNGAPIGPVGRGGHFRAMLTATYDEGASVGYKWFFEHGHQPLFQFGFGL